MDISDALQKVRYAAAAGARFGPHAGSATSAQVVLDHRLWPTVTRALNDALDDLRREEWDEEAQGPWEKRPWTCLPIWGESRTPAERAALVDRAIALVGRQG